MISRKLDFSFITGFFVGFIFCYLILQFTSRPKGDYYDHESSNDLPPPMGVQEQLHAAYQEGEELTKLNWTDLAHSHENENIAVADILTKSVRVLCMVLSTKRYHDTRAIHVKETWGRRCNKLIFASDADDEKLGAIAISNLTTYNTVWGKIKAVFKWAYNEHLNDFDWFLKCDDDTYVIMENLRLALSEYSPNDPLLMGRRFKLFTPQGYMSGGAGYLLSRKAVEKFVTESLRTPRVCKIKDNTGAEDVEMGKCLYGVGVTIADSRDSEGRQRFFPFTPKSHINDNYGSQHWIWTYDYYNLQLGPSCCSDTAAAFHYITPSEMHTLEYIIYHLKPFGIAVSHDADLVKKVLTKNNYTLV